MEDFERIIKDENAEIIRGILLELCYSNKHIQQRVEEIYYKQQKMDKITLRQETQQLIRDIEERSPFNTKPSEIRAKNLLKEWLEKDL